MWKTDTLFGDWAEDDDQWFVAHRSSKAEESDGSTETWIVACRVDSELVTACRT
ncbi:MAG: hypothetical protein O3C27_02345 [Actinomycetota bacterium]|nr:hypothetical protein [Actinomycetota bacterium]